MSENKFNKLCLMLRFVKYFLYMKLPNMKTNTKDYLIYIMKSNLLKIQQNKKEEGHSKF